jgi:Zn-dependent protease
MFGKSFPLFRVLGFPIRIDVSWFVVVVLVTWSLSDYFPTVLEGQSTATYWWMGAAGALGLFTSVVLHELAHAVVARRFGLSIRGITLFIFGGVAEMESEPPSPKAEFWVAIAGPIASAAIGGGCLLMRAAAEGAGMAPPLIAVFAYLGLINLMLVVFNLIPAFPLDGGRILRSLLWHVQGSLRRSTRITSRIGAGFGIALILFGVMLVVLGGAEAFVSGMWMFLIGMFLRGAAQMSYQQLLVRSALEGEPVRRFMKTDPVTVSRAMPVSELVQDYVYRHHFKMFPVVDNGRLVGCVSTRQIQGLPREEWDRTSVGALTESCSSENTTAPDDDTLAALTKMNKSGMSRLMVVEGDRLVGILALKDLLQFLALKVELEGDG